MRGSAFLALWNDHDGAAYDFWHTREHVGERLGIAGMLFARRYVDGRGELPGYFTLYGLEDIAVLESAAYRALLKSPTEWSLSMRPGMRNFLRRGCRLAESVGGGVGGWLAASLFRAVTMEKGRFSLAGLGAARGLSAAHLGFVNENVSGVPFSVAEAPAVDERNAVLLLEGYDPDALASEVEKMSEALQRRGLCAAPPAFSFYKLAFALERDGRGEMLPFEERGG
jgi:hypothetical protein